MKHCKWPCVICGTGGPSEHSLWRRATNEMMQMQQRSMKYDLQYSPFLEIRNLTWFSLQTRILVRYTNHFQCLSCSTLSRKNNAQLEKRILRKKINLASLMVEGKICIKLCIQWCQVLATFASKSSSDQQRQQVRSGHSNAIPHPQQQVGRRRDDDDDEPPAPSSSSCDKEETPSPWLWPSPELRQVWEPQRLCYNCCSSSIEKLQEIINRV